MHQILRSYDSVTPTALLLLLLLYLQFGDVFCLRLLNQRMVFVFDPSMLTLFLKAPEDTISFKWVPRSQWEQATNWCHRDSCQAPIADI